MKLIEKPAAKKAMRVATILTGATACAAAYMPVGPAHAVVTGGGPAHKPTAAKPEKPKLVMRVPAVGLAGLHGTPVAHDVEPYSLSVFAQPTVSKFQACGYHPPNGAWRCTAYQGNKCFELPMYFCRYQDVGGNIRSWNRGLIRLYWNGGGPGLRNQCNTNISVVSSSANGHRVAVSAGTGISNCAY
jgi:hypothetical protein